MKKGGRKLRLTALVTAVMMIASSVPAHAGWEGGPGHWWWRNSDGSYPAGGIATLDGVMYSFDKNGYLNENEWVQMASGKWRYCLPGGAVAVSQWIDGTYYVDSQGLMMTDAWTPDGYYVGADGRWTGAQNNRGNSGQIDYASAYQSAIQEAIQRRRSRLASGDLISDMYNRLAYQLCDITGDGVKELILRQMENKHAEEVRVYGLNNGRPYFMGDFGADTIDIICAGYRQGMLLMSEYKGSYDLKYQEYTGYGFVEHTLFSGSWDYWERGNGPKEPMEFEELTAYYDKNRITDYPSEYVAVD